MSTLRENKRAELVISDEQIVTESAPDLGVLGRAPPPRGPVAAADTTDVLSRCFGEEGEHFFERYWEREVLFVAQPPGAAELRRLFSVAQAEALLHEGYKEIRVVKDGKRLPRSRISEPVAVAQAVASGATLVLNRIHRAIPAIGELCGELRAALRMPLGCNGYLTPQDGRGLLPHRDDHDVLVVQIDGSKRWSIWGSPEVPSRDGRTYVLEELGEQPSMVWTAEPGDVAYLPRGAIHMARTESEHSLHLTIGLTVLTWADAFYSLLDQAVHSPPFAASVPPSAPAAELERELDVRKAMLEQYLTADWLLRLNEDRALRAEFAPDLGLLETALSIDAVSPETRLTRTAGPWAIDRDGDEAVLRGRGRYIRFPSSAYEGVATALESSEVRVGDLLPDHSEESAVTVARRLMIEGVFRLV